MANLYSGTIKSNGRYIDLAQATGITFVTGNIYQIQFYNKGYIREGMSNDTGFYISSIEPFSLKYTGDPIYVQSNTNLQINIAE